MLAFGSQYEHSSEDESEKEESELESDWSAPSEDSINLGDSESEIRHEHKQLTFRTQNTQRSKLSRQSKSSLSLKFNPVRFLAMALKDRARDREILTPQYHEPTPLMKTPNKRNETKTPRL